MKHIHILSPGFAAPNSAAFLMPLIRFAWALKQADFDVLLFNKECKSLTDCDYLFIDSKAFKNHWAHDFEGTLAHIAVLNEKTPVIWCDTGDSTGTFLGQVLPHVHRYLKAQLLIDRSEYMREHYASRIWGEYYHKKDGITDDEPYLKHVAQNESDLKKLGISWNSGMMNYGFVGPYLRRLRSHLPLNAMLHFAKRLKSANSPRPMDVTCRMGIPYPRATMRYQREKMRDILADRLPTNKLSRRHYFDELCQSKVCVSPFGLGEITLKDFECFLTGSILFKPDISHMQTWPHFYEDGVTYLSHDWDLETVEERMDWALSHEKERIEIAQNGQERYCAHTVNKEAGELFVKHFQNIVSSF